MTNPRKKKVEAPPPVPPPAPLDPLVLVAALPPELQVSMAGAAMILGLIGNVTTDWGPPTLALERAEHEAARFMRIMAGLHVQRLAPGQEIDLACLGTVAPATPP